MKKLLILLVAFVVIGMFPQEGFAARCRYSYDDDLYCEDNGYELRGNSYCEPNVCVFPDGSTCRSDLFLNGTCGQEFRKEVSCVGNGERKSSYEECCFGKSVFHNGPGGFAHWTTCEPFVPNVVASAANQNVLAKGVFLFTGSIVWTFIASLLFS